MRSRDNLERILTHIINGYSGFIRRFLPRSLAGISTVFILPALFLVFPMEATGSSKGESIITEVESVLNRDPGAVYLEEVTVGPDSTHRGDILIVGASLSISGTVSGNIFIVNGDLSLRGESEVAGRIVVLGGKAFSSRIARISGELEVYSYRIKVERRGNQFYLIREEGGREGEVNLELRGLKGLGVGPYSRVDGLPLLFHAAIHEKDPEAGWTPNRKGIYRIAAHRWGWDLFLEYRRLWKFNRIGAGYSSNTATNDRYRMGDFENSIAALLFKEDFRNYYEKRAFEAWLEFPFGEDITVGFEFETAENRGLPRMAELSLFGWGKEFRVNPPVEEGRTNSVSLFLTFDTRDNEESPESGWLSTVSFEKAGDPLGGDFDFFRYEADVRKYNRLGYRGHLDFRFFFHSGSDPLPALRILSIGGVGGLRGYPDNISGGGRVLVGSTDFRYLLTEGLAHSVFFRDGMDIVLFCDAGDAKTGPENLTAKDLKADAGVGISGSGLLTYFGVFLA